MIIDYNIANKKLYRITRFYLFNPSIDLINLQKIYAKNENSQSNSQEI